MARKKGSRSRKVNVKKFRLKVLALSAGVIALFGCVAGAIHHFGDEDTKDRVESVVAATIDIVRESSLAPDELVFLLDQVADNLPFVHGVSVATGAEIVAGDYAVGGLPKSETALSVLQNAGYVVGYDEARGNPAWCAYKIFPPKSFDIAGRPSFSEDARSRRRPRVTSGDYTSSGYDRGHMAPNQSIGACYGDAAQMETFLMTNVTPQLHSLNAGVWKNLEQRALRRYTHGFGDIWVICGPIYFSRDNGGSGKKIGKAGVEVPDAFFMILADVSEENGEVRTLAFIVPQKEKLDTDLKKYLASIDEIEAETGLDFFSDFSKEAQAQLESRAAKAVW